MFLSPQAAGSEILPIRDFQVRLFGPFTVRIQGALLPPLHSRKGAWLLALLILKNSRPVERTWLAATLWPDSAPSEALKNLRNTLHDLRRALGTQEDRIQSPTPGALRLDLDQADVDLLTFDAGLKRGDPASLGKAVALYAGLLLEGCEEEWVVLERQQRQQACANALEMLAASELKAGKAAQAAQYLRTCIGIDAYRETAHCALMTALAAAGDYAGVTQAYRELRMLLHEQLHTSPAAETTALYQQIRVRARTVAAGGATAMLPTTRSAPLANATPDDTSIDLLTEPEEPPAGPEPPHNLPPALTAFIGREQESADVIELLAQTPLLTLTGTGGAGKTRLSLHVADRMRAAYPDGVWLVELASLSDPALVVQTVASVLDIREQPGLPLLQTLVATLKSKTLLLVLDNCEHLVASCAQLASVMLRSCPGVCLLATSRERLGIAGEQTYRVPSLSLPDLNAPLTLERIERYESVRLFVERARLTGSDFHISSENAAAVASVCHRLDGIPLAIELAAARVRSLSVEDLQSRLDDRFQLLKGGDRSALPRQQTLRALVDWSYNLLSDEEKMLLQQVSVFVGGWTLAAAEEVTREEGEDVLDLLTSLVDKSLVVAEVQGASARYSLLQTVRHYALEKLSMTGKAQIVRRRHRDCFLALTEKAEPHLKGPEQVMWFSLLEAEHDNLRAALACCEQEAEPQVELQMAGALWRFWYVRSHFREGREYMERALERGEVLAATIVRAKSLHGAGVLAWSQSDNPAARVRFQESLLLFAELGDKNGIADVLGNLGNMAREQREYTKARELHEESLRIRRELRDRQGIAISLNGLGIVAREQGDYAVAQALCEESLSIRRELGDRGGIASSLSVLASVVSDLGDYTRARVLFTECLAIDKELGDRQGSAISLHNLGLVAYRQGDYAAAQALYEESLRIRRELGDRRGVAFTLERLAAALQEQGGAQKAVRLWGAAHSLRESIGAAPSPRMREIYDAQVAQAHATLGEDAFAAAWEQGRMMTLEHAIASALDPDTGSIILPIG